MGIAGRLLIEQEQFTQLAQGEVALYVLLLIHHTAAQGLFMGLPLQNLLLYCSRLARTYSQMRL